MAEKITDPLFRGKITEICNSVENFTESGFGEKIISISVFWRENCGYFFYCKNNIVNQVLNGKTVVLHFGMKIEDPHFGGKIIDQYFLRIITDPHFDREL